jgi:peptidyl-prolyl cis-trans isomerase C
VSIETREPLEPEEARDASAGDGEGTGGPPGSSRSWRAVVVVVAIVAGLSVLGLSALGGDSCPPSGAALEVRGEVVRQDELDRRADLLKALYGVEPPGESERDRAGAFPRDLAKAVAVGLIVQAEVADRDLQVAEKAVRDALDRFIDQRFPEGGRERFVQALGNEGVSEAEVLAEIRRLLETRRLFDQVTDGVTVDDARVAAAFEERKDRLAVPERRRLRHLVVATEEQARAALGRIRGGEDFGAVATEVSLDAATKMQGGELGPLAAGDLAAPFAEAAFAAPAGQAFGPVQTDFGWHVGLVEDVTPRRAVTLDEVRDSLRQQLVGEERLALWRKFLGRRIAEADACYGDRFRPEDPDAPPPDVGSDLTPP